MIYTALTNRAMRVAYEAHMGQVDDLSGRKLGRKPRR